MTPLRQSLLISLWGGHDSLICRQLSPTTALLRIIDNDKRSTKEDSIDSDCSICKARRDSGLVKSLIAPQNLYPTSLSSAIQISSTELIERAYPDNPKVDAIVVAGDQRAIALSANLANHFRFAFVGSISSIYEESVATTNFDSGATIYDRSNTCGYVITQIDLEVTDPNPPENISTQITNNPTGEENRIVVDGSIVAAKSASEMTATTDFQTDRDSFMSFHVERSSTEVASLATSKIVIVAGGGLKDKAAIEKIIEVAEALNIAYGATRVICDAGLMDHSRQIGTTGVTITPQLYIALGVSGQPQHLGGLENIGEGISFNLDKGAPINTFVDEAYIGDANEILDQLYQRVMDKNV